VTEELLIKDVKKYFEELTRQGFTPKKIDPTLLLDTRRPEHVIAAKEHILYMCEGILKYIEKSSLSDAWIWYGGVQMLLWALGEHTIEELRQDNVEQPE
jgi:hypothetical protein